jgi:transcriptional regulator with XRE-family HTH domain
VNAAPDIPIGERLCFYRRSQHKSQAVIAGLAGMTEDYLSKVERGLKTPTIATLHRLAVALGVSVPVLLGEPSVSDRSVVHPVASRIQAALMSYGTAARTELLSLPALRGRLDSAWSAWQGAPHRFTEVSAVLPELVVDVQHAARVLRSDEAQVRETARLSADLYFLLRTFAKRIGRPDLALLVADRAMTAAHDADDPVRLAAAQWNLAHILIAQGEPEGALEVARIGAEQVAPALESGAREQAAMYGALWLTAAIATMRLGEPWTARDILREKAWPAARIAGEGNVMWTVFGPSNVDLHAMSIEMETGEVAEALRIADRIDIAASPSLERRTTFALEVARCYEQRRDDAGVLVHLVSAEFTGPEDLRYNLLARDLIRGLLKRARPSLAPQAQGLAARVGLIDT